MQKLPKQRLDQILVDHGLCESRNKAQRLILAGKVMVNEKVVDKPGTLFIVTGKQIGRAHV